MLVVVVAVSTPGSLVEPGGSVVEPVVVDVEDVALVEESELELESSSSDSTGGETEVMSGPVVLASELEPPPTHSPDSPPASPP